MWKLLWLSTCLGRRGKILFQIRDEKNFTKFSTYLCSYTEINFDCDLLCRKDITVCAETVVAVAQMIAFIG